MSNLGENIASNVSIEQFYRLDENGHLIVPSTTPDKDLKNIVLVPTEQLLLMSVFVPGKKQSEWQQALPFVLEEQLSQPVDVLFFAVLNRDKDGQVAVAIIEKEKLANWTEELKAHDLDDAELVADIFSLPYSNNDLTAVKTGERLLVRTGKYKGLAGVSSWVEQVLELENKSLSATHSSSVKVLPRSMLASLKSMSLRQASFKIKKTTSSVWKLWTLPIVLFIGFIIIYLASFQVQTSRYKQQEVAYKQQTEKLFKQMFPLTTRIVNIRAQTKAKLARVSKGSNTSGVTIIIHNIEAYLASAISKKNIDIKSMQWKKQQLRLLIEAKNVEILDKLVKQFSTKHQVKLKLKTLASQGNKQVTGEIYVK